MTTNYLRPALWSMLLLGLTFTSCKEEEKADPPPTKRELLIANNWVTTRVEVEPAIDIDQNGTQENNLTPYLLACDLDDFLNLKSDNNYIIEEGPSKCDPNDPQVIETGTWTLNTDATLLVLTSNGTNLNYTIKALSSSQLITENKVVNNIGVTYTFTTTYD